MRRSHFVLMLALAGCASPASHAPQPHHVPPAPAKPAPAPAQPVTPPTVSGDMVFDAWAAEFYDRALKAGVKRATLERELKGLTPDPRVANLDTRQPEFSKPISEYIKGVVTDGRASMGQSRRAAPYFDAIEQRFGVPREILMGVWAMESGFGAIQGNFDVIRSMATLAAQGRRRQFAEDQLIAALKLIEAGEVSREQLKGSWAGAMGQTQFIPTSFMENAVDGDGDGKRDIWRSDADALASAANLLKAGGWTPGQDWAREVVVPEGFDYSLTEGPKQSPAEWARLGVKRADGLPWTTADENTPAQLLAPTGAGGPLFLAFPNHFAIRKYNNSVAYALAVGLLADRISGRELVRPWPAEQPLSLADRMTAQRALAALGFDPGKPDGVIGMGTRTALRNWQKARGLTADGYLSGEMVQRLKREAGVS